MVSLFLQDCYGARNSAVAEEILCIGIARLCKKEPIRGRCKLPLEICACHADGARERIGFSLPCAIEIGRKDEAPARFGNAFKLTRRRIGVLQKMDYIGGDNRIKCTCRKGQAKDIRLQKFRIREAFAFSLGAAQHFF